MHHLHFCSICRKRNPVILPISFTSLQPLFLIWSLGAALSPGKHPQPCFEAELLWRPAARGVHCSLRALKLSRGGHFWREFGPRRVRLGANKSRLIGEEGFTRRTSLAQQLMRSPVATSPSTWSSVLETILNLQWHKIDKQWNSPDITIRSLSSKSKTCGSRSVPELPCWNYSLWHHSNLDSVYCCIWACWLRAYMRKPFFCAFFFQLKRE